MPASPGVGIESWGAFKELVVVLGKKVVGISKYIGQIIIDEMVWEKIKDWLGFDTISSLSERISVLESWLENYKSQGHVGAEYEEVKSAIEEIKSYVNQLKHLKERLDELDSKYAEHDVKIKNLEKRVVLVEAQVVINSSRIDAVDSALAKLSRKVHGGENG